MRRHVERSHLTILVWLDVVEQFPFLTIRRNHSGSVLPIAGVRAGVDLCTQHLLEQRVEEFNRHDKGR